MQANTTMAGSPKRMALPYFQLQPRQRENIKLRQWGFFQRMLRSHSSLLASANGQISIPRSHWSIRSGTLVMQCGQTGAW